MFSSAKQYEQSNNIHIEIKQQRQQFGQCSKAECHKTTDGENRGL